MVYNRHYLDKKSIPFFAETIVGHFLRQPGYCEIAIVCLGSTRYARDSLGPKIGSRLAERLTGESRVCVIGTLAEPAHALNLSKTLVRLSAVQERCFVIAVDACLGEHYKIGTLQLVDEPLQPGAAFGKPLPVVGHIHFKGIVNNYGPLKPEVLDHPSLRFIDEMALVMSRGLIRAVQQIVPLLLPNGEQSSGTTDSLSSGM